MSDVVEPLNWASGPKPFRQAHENVCAERDELRARVDRETELRREVVFLRALGASMLDSTQGRMFERSYDGPLDVELVHEAFNDMRAELLAEALDVNGGDLRALVAR